MYKKSLLLLFLSLYFSNAQLSAQHSTGHNYLVEQFEKYANSSNLTYSVETMWFQQPVDHFNSLDTRTWKMKILRNFEKYRPGNPVYIFIGGEGKTTEYLLTAGLLNELAEETNGAMFATEHRYYGESNPFNPITRENIRYLSSSQALADLAVFITSLKQSPDFKNSKIVVIGGSYAGNLAAWMRLHYPQLVDAAIASSAPVLAKMDFSEYFETVGDDFQKYATPECYAVIKNTFSQIIQALKSEAGIEQLKQTFKICKDSDLIKTENQELLFDKLLNPLGAAAQYGTVAYIQNFCNKDVTNYLKPYINYGCNDLEFNQYYNSQTPINSFITWYYQSCTEFGYFMTAPSNQPFAGITLGLNFYTKMCSSIFGSQFNEGNIAKAVQHTNNVNGGLTPNVTNVIFVYGEIDPWHRLGVTKDLSETALVKVIPEASHCKDLFPDSYSSAEVIRMKKEEKDFIKRCIGFKDNKQ